MRPTPEPNLLPPIPEDQRDVPWIPYDSPEQMPPVDVPTLRYVVRYQVGEQPWRDDTLHSTSRTALARARSVMAEFLVKGHEEFSVVVVDRDDPEGGYVWTPVEADE